MQSNLSPVGRIIEGSLSSGLVMRLEGDVGPEELKAGRFMVIVGDLYTYFCIITDANLAASNRDVLGTTLPTQSAVIRNALYGTQLHTNIELKPALVVPNEDEGYDGRSLNEIINAGLSIENLTTIREKLSPARSIPPHFAPVFFADDSHLQIVFGAEEEEGVFKIGEAMEMPGLPLCVNLEKLSERSAAIFGKTGTGKTYLALLLLSGIIKQDVASALIFDAHNDYGATVSSEEPGGGGSRKSLRSIFGSKVRVYTLDKKSNEARAAKFDYEVKIPFEHIEPQDIMLLGGVLNLTPTAPETLHLLLRRFGKHWLKTLLDGDVDTLAEDCGANASSLGALQRRLSFVQTLSYLTPQSLPKSSTLDDYIYDDIQNGRSIVVEFGKYQDIKSYLLVSNIITRRLHQRYVEATELSYGGGARPRRLVIVIEEAHRFLAPDIASNTVFGTIAREMRKFGVTLIVIDQRPSAIYDEVMSQIGTRLVAQLSDDKDLSAVTVGAQGGSQLRNILGTLAGKQQALLFGYALPMPVVIDTRTFDDSFAEEVGSSSNTGKEKGFEERW